MPRLDREQAISVAVFVLLLLVSLSVMGMSLQSRSDAVRESSERREMLSRLEARLRAVASRPTAAPPAAFLDASTSGLASAQLQSYLGQLRSEEHTSELQSRPHLVCRLLLEKKKKKKKKKKKQKKKKKRKKK